MYRPAGFTAVLFAGLALASAAGASGAGPTGNTQAITFARSVRQAYRHVPGVSYTQHGYVVMSSQIGRSSFFRWSWGTGYTPSGWVFATEHALVVLHDGRVLWARDDLAPPPCTNSPIGCPTVPVEVLVTRAGAFWRFNEPARQFACFDRLHGSAPFLIGSDWIGLSGAYGPLKHQGSSVLTRVTSRWSADQTSTETNTISAATRLISSYAVSVSKGVTAMQPAFTFAATVSNLTHAPAKPKLKRCR